MAAASYSFVTDTVFVRGIPSDTTDEQLLERFADVGPVKHAYCLRDKLTHRAKYGFVKFAIREDAQVAVDTLSGALLNGKKMMVENAVERGAEGVDKSAIAQAKTQRRNERATARQQERESKLRTVVLWAPRGSNSQQDDGSGSDSDSGSDSSSSSSSSSSSEISHSESTAQCSAVSANSQRPRQRASTPDGHLAVGRPPSLIAHLVALGFFFRCSMNSFADCCVSL